MYLFRLPAICCVILLSQGAKAETIAERLATYHGKAGDAVVADLGTATVQTPDQWVYLFNELRPDVPPAEPGPLDPALGARRNGVGMGPQTPTGTPPLPCELRFDLDDHQRVAQTSHRGPGCFEIVFSRTKPAN